MTKGGSARWFVPAVGVVFFLGALGLSRIATRANTPSGYGTFLPDSTTKYLLFVYIAKGSCPACQQQDVVTAVATAREMVRRRAIKAGAGFHSIGVALDVTPDRGLTYLKKVGPFHEVMSGGGWIGLGADRYLWSEFGPPVSTPQILVIRRIIAVDRIPPRTRDYKTTDGPLLVRKVGSTEIRSWMEMGAPVPTIATEQGG